MSRMARCTPHAVSGGKIDSYRRAVAGSLPALQISLAYFIVTSSLQSWTMTTARLSDREKECLRLLLAPMRPKDIAHALNLSVHTVNGHLQQARRKLGATDSLSAARMLRRSEAPLKNEGVNILVSENASSLMQGNEADASIGTEVGRDSWQSPIARDGRPWNDLDLRWRIAWPIALFFLVAMGVSALSSGAASLSTIYLSLSR